MKQTKIYFPFLQGNLKLPSSVFASEFEEKIGLPNRAAPRSGPLIVNNPDVLEVLETLDDAFEVEEVVKGSDLAEEFKEDDENETVEGGDDFDDIMAEMVAEGGEGSDEYGSERSDIGSDFYGSDFGEEDDEVPDLHGRFMFANEETKSRFTEYSMSSSVVPRSEQLANLDDQFEEFFDKYDEEKTGGLDLDEIEGFRTETSKVMDNLVDEFEKQKATERQKPDFEKMKEIILNKDVEDDDLKNSEEELETVEVPREKWDCESIISTYSNIYHHPKLISEASKKVQ